MINYLNISRTISDAGLFLQFACIRINQTVRTASGFLWCGQCWTCSWAICLLRGRFRFTVTYIWHIAGMYIWLYGFYDHRWNIWTKSSKMKKQHRTEEKKREEKKRTKTKTRTMNQQKKIKWKGWSAFSVCLCVYNQRHIVIIIMIHYSVGWEASKTLMKKKSALVARKLPILCSFSAMFISRTNIRWCVCIAHSNTLYIDAYY